MKMLIHSLKRYGVWATALTDRYRFNPFVQATVHVIALMVILAGLLIAISGWSIQYAQTNTVGSISTHYQAQLNPTIDTQFNSMTLPQAISSVRQRSLAFVFTGLVLLIGLFGYLIIRFALSPIQESVQVQKRFIGNVAHEIRTPLAIIKTSTEVSLMDPALSDDVRDTFKGTIVELDRISDTINNLLSFDTLMRPGRMKTELVDLAKVVEMVLKRHNALAASRAISLTSKIGSNHVVIGNPTALEQVATNLVKNSLNYTPAEKDGQVAVNIETDYRGKVVLAVTDNGIGIAQKDLYHVFEPFYRGDTSRARGVGTGTSGLGLAIVNEIVRMHKGTISIKSALGHGTTITISLPPAPDGSSPEQLLPSHEAVDAGIHEVSVDFS